MAGSICVYSFNWQHVSVQTQCCIRLLTIWSPQHCTAHTFFRYLIASSFLRLEWNRFTLQSCYRWWEVYFHGWAVFEIHSIVRCCSHNSMFIGTAAQRHSFWCTSRVTGKLYCVPCRQGPYMKPIGLESDCTNWIKATPQEYDCNLWHQLVLVCS